MSTYCILRQGLVCWFRQSHTTSSEFQPKIQLDPQLKLGIVKDKLSDIYFGAKKRPLQITLFVCPEGKLAYSLLLLDAPVLDFKI